METIEDIRKLPDLTDDAVHIWGVHLPDVLGRLEELGAVLNAEERKKADRFHRESDRQSSIISRGALRVLLSGYTGAPADQITFDYSENGKPHVMNSGIDFNVSHSGDWIVLAIGQNRRVGADIEAIRREVDVEAIAARYFTPGEITFIEDAEDRHAAFFRLWARKEAYVKARGSALFRELSTFQVPLDGEEKEGWFFHDLEAGSRHAAAVVTDRVSTAYPCFDFCGLQWW